MNDTLLDETGRIAGNNGIRRNILHNNSASGHKHIFVDGDAGTNKSICTDPDTISDCDGTTHERKVANRMIMRTSTEVDILRNKRMIANMERPKVIHQHTIS